MSLRPVEPMLVSIELRFVTNEDPDALAERIRESVSLIVGRQALEEYRARSMPLSPPKKRGS